MPATKYKVWAVGGPVGKGVTQSINVGVHGIAKAASASLPYVVVNELVCSYLAKALLLQVPPGFIIENNKEPHFVSMNFNLAGEDLPPVNPKDIVDNHPKLSCGIILFDAWVLNSDRHTRNIAYEKVTDKVQIFDHSHAFLSNKNPEEHFKNNKTQLGIGGHCLAKAITSLNGMEYWYERINAIPEFYINEVIQSAETVGLPVGKASICTNFLLERRDKLLEVVTANTKQFPQVQPELWDDLKTEETSETEGAQS